MKARESFESFIRVTCATCELQTECKWQKIVFDKNDNATCDSYVKLKPLEWVKKDNRWVAVK